MASEMEKEFLIFRENMVLVERFVHDVLVYTLTKCGLPASSLPTTDCDEIIYPRKDLIQIAGASVLRISLVMRDTWKRMFKSRNKSCGFNDGNILMFILKLGYCYRSIRPCFKKSVAEMVLASGNEIVLYFNLEKIDFDFKNLLKQISGCIASAPGLDRNKPEKLEEFFDCFDNISEYTEWITDFISSFAIPYGSSDDVSDLFIKHIKEKFEDDFKKLTDSFRFLPSDLFSALIAGKSENSAEFTSVRRGGQSPEHPNSSMDGEVSASGESILFGSMSTRAVNVSEPLPQNEIRKLEQRDTTEGSKRMAKIKSISNNTKSMEEQKLPTDSDMEKKSEQVVKSSSIVYGENISESKNISKNQQ